MTPEEKIAVLRKALERISKWHGEFPETGNFYNNGKPTSYLYEHGSNGERNYMRSVSQAALDLTK